MSFSPTDEKLFFSKHDRDDARLGDHVVAATIETLTAAFSDLVIFGYPDDEGIQLNGGRVGARLAPPLIREHLYKMTWPRTKHAPKRLLDLGDLNTAPALPDRHAEALRAVERLQRANARTVTLGGSHDYGYPDAAGFVEAHLKGKLKPLVINFDAHLDVRPTSTNGLSSGTPFYRLLSKYGEQIDFVEIGLQPHCNSPVHRDWALQQKAQLFNLEDLHQGLMSLFETPVFRNLNTDTPVFISFDMDCLTSSEAGGCSQAWVTGLKTQDCLDFLKRLYATAQACGLGIYETSPPFDTDFRTSKTAALLAYHFIFQS